MRILIAVTCILLIDFVSSADATKRVADIHKVSRIRSRIRHLAQPNQCQQFCELVTQEVKAVKTPIDFEGLELVRDELRSRKYTHAFADYVDNCIKMVRDGSTEKEFEKMDVSKIESEQAELVKPVESEVSHKDDSKVDGAVVNNNNNDDNAETEAEYHRTLRENWKLVRKIHDLEEANRVTKEKLFAIQDFIDVYNGQIDEQKGKLKRCNDIRKLFGETTEHVDLMSNVIKKTKDLEAESRELRSVLNEHERKYLDCQNRLDHLDRTRNRDEHQYDRIRAQLTQCQQGLSGPQI